MKCMFNKTWNYVGVTSDTPRISFSKGYSLFIIHNYSLFSLLYFRGEYSTWRIFSFS
jgi:hypothetical protein